MADVTLGPIQYLHGSGDGLVPAVVRHQHLFNNSCPCFPNPARCSALVQAPAYLR